MARRMPKTTESWLIPKLRRISLSWPGKAIARDNAKRYVGDGEYKNGNPKIKVMYECAHCKALVDRDEGQMDHREPVIAIKGFNDWNDFVARLFCNPDAYDHLCIPCHSKKTNAENRNRPSFQRNLTRYKKRAKIRKSSRNNSGPNDDDIFARRKRLVSKRKRTRSRVSIRKRLGRKKAIR